MTVANTGPEKTPFEVVTEEINLKTDNDRIWWQKAGTMLAKVLDSAEYTREEQHKYLKFYADVLLPHMGSYPQTFRSSITRSGLPIELSVNYQQSGRPLVVRIGFEPLSALFSGWLFGDPKTPFGPFSSESELWGGLQSWFHQPPTKVFPEHALKALRKRLPNCRPYVLTRGFECGKYYC